MCPWCRLLDVLWRWLSILFFLLILLLLLCCSCLGFLAFFQLDLPPDSFFLPFEFFGPAPVFVPPSQLLIPPALVAFSFSTLVLELHGLLALCFSLHAPLRTGPRHTVDNGSAQKRTAAKHFRGRIALMERQSATSTGIFAEPDEAILR